MVVGGASLSSPLQPPLAPQSLTPHTALSQFREPKFVFTISLNSEVTMDLAWGESQPLPHGLSSRKNISKMIALMWDATSVACKTMMYHIYSPPHSSTNCFSVVVSLSRWIPFAMLSARQEDTVTDSQPVRCTVRRASV